MRKDRRVDRELREAVDQLTVKLVATPTSSHDDGDGYQRAAFEFLLTSSLILARASYGCALCLSGEGAYRARLLKLIAVVEGCGSRGLVPVHDALLHRKPDSKVRNVLMSGETLHEPVAAYIPPCLPRSRPEINSYLILPVRISERSRALIFLANCDDTFNQRLVRRLLALVEAFERIHLERNNQTVVVQEDDRHKVARHLVALMSASLNGILTVDEVGLVTAINPASEGLLRLTTRNALSMDARQFLGHKIVDDALRKPETTTPRFHHPAPQKFESVECKRSDGTRAVLDIVYYTTELEGRRFTTFLLNDASGVAESTSEFQEALLKYQTLTNLAPVGILHLNVDWTCVYANDMWSQLSELSSDETLNDGWIDAIHADDVVNTLVDMREALCNRQTFEREVRLQKPLGSVIWVSLKATATVNEHEVFTGCLVVAMDITEKHLWSEKMAQMAQFDALTGISNRSSFTDHLNRRIGTPQEQNAVELLYLDLDGFKAINDTMGHDAGDKLLTLVAKRLLKATDGRGLPARLGGDEFTVVLDANCDAVAAEEIADAIVSTMKIPFTVDSQEVHVSASVGWATAERDDAGADDVIKRADIALYEAKKKGRSRWIRYSSELDRDSRERSLLMTRVRRAADRNNFDVFYQPQVNVATGCLSGFEALLRWVTTSEEPNVDTQTLVSILEESGRIADVGQWVLETACKQHTRWVAAGLIDDTVSMSVNVSGRQLMIPTFYDRIMLIVERSAMNPGNLILEITESVLVEATPGHEALFLKLKASGIKLSLDDFGTGYSSLAYLSRLPLDHLKIDRAFVGTMNTKSRSKVIVNSVVALADSLGLQTVAEGVEDLAVSNALKEIGCNTIQGYLFSRPVSGAAMETMLGSDHKPWGRASLAAATPAHFDAVQLAN